VTPGFPWLALLLLGDPAAGAGAIQDGTQGEASAALAFQFVGCADDLVHDVEELIRADVAWARAVPWWASWRWRGDGRAPKWWARRAVAHPSAPAAGGQASPWPSVGRPV